MNPLLLLSAGQGLTGLISGILGASELHKANELEKDNARPTESVPQGVLDSVALSRLMANTGMPAEQYNQVVKQIERSHTNAIATARDRRSGLDVISTVQQATNDATLNLGAKSAEMRQQNQLQLMSSLQNLGSWQDKIWNWNSAQKFIENAAAIRALKGAGYANINTAADSVLSGAATATQGLTSNKTGATGFGTSTESGINLGAITGGLDANAATIQAGQPADPTLTNPELFNNGTPDAFLNYLLKLKAQAA